MTSYTSGEIKHLYSNVQRLLLLAHEYHGKCYGEYPREVLTKVLAHDFSTTILSAVHISFVHIHTGSVSEFLDKAVMLKGNKGRSSNLNEDCTKSMIFKLEDEHGDKLVDVHIVTSHPLSYYDFDINKLCWDPVEKRLYCCDRHSVTTILNNVRNRRMLVSQGMYEVVMGKENVVEIGDGEYSKDVTPLGVRRWIMDSYITIEGPWSFIKEEEYGLVNLDTKCDGSKWWFVERVEG